MKRHANPKPTHCGKAHLKKVAKEAFPKYTLEFCSHSDLGGHRAPRDHTLGFRLKDSRGNYKSNVIWVMPQALQNWTSQNVRNAVKKANGCE
ncbi:MAG: hypothetical protein P1V20_18090 [Verrucomicrobiales bacterium]|nr:hypothetical protein [Verrucomicrobiales bacterium]